MNTIRYLLLGAILLGAEACPAAAQNSGTDAVKLAQQQSPANSYQAVPNQTVPQFPQAAPGTYQPMVPYGYPNQPRYPYPGQPAYPPQFQAPPPSYLPYPGHPLPMRPPPQQARPTQQPYAQTPPKTQPVNGPGMPGAPKDQTNMSEFLGQVGNARQLISSGNPALAVESLDKAVNLRPRNLSVYFYRGLAYDESGDPSKAVKNYLESLDRAKTVGMDSAELRANLGNSYMKLNYCSDAILEYKRAIDIEPRFAAAHLGLGRALLAKGEYLEALKSLRRCEALGLIDPTLPYLKALALAASGEKQEALGELSPLLSEETASKSPQLHKMAEELKRDLK